MTIDLEQMLRDMTAGGLVTDYMCVHDRNPEAVGDAVRTFVQSDDPWQLFGTTYHVDGEHVQWLVKR